MYQGARPIFTESQQRMFKREFEDDVGYVHRWIRDEERKAGVRMPREQAYDFVSDIRPAWSRNRVEAAVDEALRW